MIRGFLGDIDGSLWIEGAWAPELMRAGDVFITEVYLQNGASVAKLATLNSCRLYLRAVTLSDIVNPGAQRSRGGP